MIHLLFLAATSSSITFYLTGIGLIPISTATSCGLSIGNKVLFEIIINKYHKYKKKHENDQQSIQSFDKLYRKTLQDNVNDKTESGNLCNIIIKKLDEKKMNLFYKIELKKNKIFSVIKR